MPWNQWIIVNVVDSKLVGISGTCICGVGMTLLTEPVVLIIGLGVLVTRLMWQPSALRRPWPILLLTTLIQRDHHQVCPTPSARTSISTLQILPQHVSITAQSSAHVSIEALVDSMCRCVPAVGNPSQHWSQHQTSHLRIDPIISISSPSIFFIMENMFLCVSIDAHVIWIQCVGRAVPAPGNSSANLSQNLAHHPSLFRIMFQ